MDSIVCIHCGSTNVDSEEELHNKQYRKITDASLDWNQLVCVSGSVVLVCTCNDCKKSFEVNVRGYKRDLYPGEFYID